MKNNKLKNTHIIFFEENLIEQADLIFKYNINIEKYKQYPYYQRIFIAT